MVYREAFKQTTTSSLVGILLVIILFLPIIAGGVLLYLFGVSDEVVVIKTLIGTSIAATLWMPFFISLLLNIEVEKRKQKRKALNNNS